MNIGDGRISLGTVQFGLDYGVANKTGQLASSEVKAVLQTAYKNKVDTLDTAIAYGSSEIRLGEAGVEKFKVVTKLPEMPENLVNVNDWLEGHVRSSMTRLGVKSLRGLLLHKPLQLLGSRGHDLFRAMLKIKEKQIVEKIGISVYSTGELDLILKKFNFDLVQAPFNLIDQGLYHSGWLHRLKDGGVEIHARSVFLQGLLILRRQCVPIKFSNWDCLWEKWEEWLIQHNASPLRTCLAFPLSFKEVDKVVVGVDSAAQLSEIMIASRGLERLDFPDIKCNDERLINPSRWVDL